MTVRDEVRCETLILFVFDTVCLLHNNFRMEKTDCMYV